MTLRILLVISMLAAVAPAAVKRDEFGGASEHTSSGGSSSSQNYQPGSSGSNQGNLYYYYYPVQDKNKEHAYQASSSNQFTSAVTPGNGNSASAGSESTGSAHTSALEPATGGAGGQDLSYSAQDLSYSAQSLGQGMSGQGMADYNSQPGGGSSNYDQLSNIASQLQQYAFGNGGSSGSSFNPSGSGYGPSPTSYNSGNSYSSSGDASGTGYGAASGSSPSGSLFPASANEASNPYSGSGPVSGFGPGAPGYPGQPGQMPYGSQPGYGYQSHSYDAYPSASNQHASYEPPSTGYRRYGIGSAILPILALAGLSLLIPTVTSLSTAATGRKRRSTDSPIKDSGLGAYLDRIERYYSLYKTAVEREECMNRIICELGDALSNVRGKSTLFNIMEKFVPTWMGNKVGVLKNGALSPEYGKCKKYTCQ